MRDPKKVVAAVQPVFEAYGIWSDVDQSESKFWQVPQMSAHIVLNDASKYEVAMDALRQIELQQKAQHQTFEWKLRSKWKIERAEHRGVYGPEGPTPPPSEIYVELRSGQRVMPIRVAFTHHAGNDLRIHTGTAQNDFETHRQEQVDKTRKYIELLLAAHGNEAWDPLSPGEDKLTIDSNALARIIQKD